MPTLQETLTELEALNTNQSGVKLGDIRKLAKQIKSNHELALELWATENFNARMLAILLLKPKRLSSEELEQMVRSLNAVRVADWLNAYVVKKHPDNEALRLKWIHDDNPMVARAGWHLTAERIAKEPEGLDLPVLLDHIGETLGIYRDYPVSRGCTSPFAPIWIEEMVSRES